MTEHMNDVNFYTITNRNNLLKTKNNLYNVSTCDRNISIFFKYL